MFHHLQFLIQIDRSKRLKQEVKRYKRVQHTAIPPPQPQPNYTEAQETLLQVNEIVPREGLHLTRFVPRT